ncbi:hypothetical protein CK203_047175 [Vitis vinifera]|uniref:Uncharacterized protein n=1 Tax=Vitis vinifera TaxID=29760 RepID=A0A438GSN8_VITVI|nr:hypothetical protein CK203_047175 [Vitis vinifera]
MITTMQARIVTYSLVRDHNRGGAFFDWMLWIWRVRDLASSFPKEEEQRVVGLQWWRRYGVWCVQTGMTSQKKEEPRSKPNMAKTFAEVTNMSRVITTQKPFAKVVQSMQGKNNGERKNRVKKTEDNSCSLLSHFWSTSRSPFSTCYIPFQSSGSQQSNASNGAQFGVEMKDAVEFLLKFPDICDTLKVEHRKLKANFAALRNQPFAAK